MNRNGQKFGFTLIELLVVISIIAMLMGILMPALSSARNAAKQVVCASNVRQLAVANTVYSVDHKDYYAPAAYDYKNNLHRWHGEREKGSPVFDGSKSVLREYLGPEAIRECPAFNGFSRENPGAWNGAFEAGCGGYGYNEHYIGGRYDLFDSYVDATKSTARAGDVKDPTRTVMFADTGMWQQEGSSTYLIENSFLKGRYFLHNKKPDTTSSPTPSMHFRHPRTTLNVAWADTHVDSRKLEWSLSNYDLPSSTPESMMELKSGWFGPKDNSLFDLE